MKEGARLRLKESVETHALQKTGSVVRVRNMEYGQKLLLVQLDNGPLIAVTNNEVIPERKGIIGLCKQLIASLLG